MEDHSVNSSTNMIVNVSEDKKENETLPAPDEPTSETFQRYMYDLFEKNGVLNDLRSYLRGHIVNVLRSAQSGKSLLCQKNFTQRLEFASQALNILISEYLICLEFRYSLSVFVSEIPLANMVFSFAKTLMTNDDENSKPRFNENDIWCILNYLGIQCDSEQALNILELYKTENSPLLVCILKSSPLYKKPVDIVESPSSHTSASTGPSSESIADKQTKPSLSDKCRHYAFCNTCQKRMAMVRDKYKRKKRNLLQMFEQLKSVYETEMTMMKEEEEKRMKKSIASHTTQLQRTRDEMEESFKAREMELQDGVAQKKRFLWGLARALRQQHRHMTRAMLNVRQETQRLSVKEDSVKAQLAEAEEDLRKRGEDVRQQISAELSVLETRLRDLQRERDNISRERAQLEHYKTSSHTINVNENINSHYDLLRADVAMVKKFMESASVPKCVSERSTSTELRGASAVADAALNNGLGARGGRRPAQLRNDLSKQKNTNFHPNSLDSLDEVIKEKVVRESSAHSSASSSACDGHWESVAALRRENDQLRALAKQQRERIDALSHQQSQLTSELNALGRTDSTNLDNPPGGSSGLAPLGVTPPLLGVRPGSEAASTALHATDGSTLLRPRTAPINLRPLDIQQRITGTASVTNLSQGWRKGAGEELSCFNALPRIVLPGEAVPFVGIVGCRPDNRRYLISQWRALRRRVSSRQDASPGISRARPKDKIGVVLRERQTQHDAARHVRVSRSRSITWTELLRFVDGELRRDTDADEDTPGPSVSRDPDIVTYQTAEQDQNTNNPYRLKRTELPVQDTCRQPYLTTNYRSNLENYPVIRKTPQQYQSSSKVYTPPNQYQLHQDSNKRTLEAQASSESQTTKPRQNCSDIQTESYIYRTERQQEPPNRVPYQSRQSNRNRERYQESPYRESCQSRESNQKRDRHPESPNRESYQSRERHQGSPSRASYQSRKSNQKRERHPESPNRESNQTRESYVNRSEQHRPMYSQSQFDSYQSIKSRETSPKSLLREAKEKLRSQDAKSFQQPIRDNSPGCVLREAKLRLRKLEIEAEAVERSYLDFRRKQEERRRSDTHSPDKRTDLDEIRHSSSATYRAESPLHPDAQQSYDKYVKEYQNCLNHFKNNNAATFRISPIPNAYAQEGKKHENYVEQPLTTFRQYYNKAEDRLGSRPRPSSPEPDGSNDAKGTRKEAVRQVKNDDKQQLELLKQNIGRLYNVPVHDIVEKSTEDQTLNIEEPQSTSIVDKSEPKTRNLLKIEVLNMSHINDFKVMESNSQDVMLIVESSVQNTKDDDMLSEVVATTEMCIVLSPKKSERHPEISDVPSPKRKESVSEGTDTKNTKKDSRSTSPTKSRRDSITKSKALTRNISPSPKRDIQDSTASETHTRKSEQTRKSSTKSKMTTDDVVAIYHEDTDDSEVMKAGDSGNTISILEQSEDPDYPDDFSADVDNFNTKSEYELPSPIHKTSDDENFWDS